MFPRTKTLALFLAGLCLMAPSLSLGKPPEELERKWFGSHGHRHALLVFRGDDFELYGGGNGVYLMLHLVDRRQEIIDYDAEAAQRDQLVIGPRFLATINRMDHVFRGSADTHRRSGKRLTVVIRHFVQHVHLPYTGSFVWFGSRDAKPENPLLETRFEYNEESRSWEPGKQRPLNHWTTGRISFFSAEQAQAEFDRRRASFDERTQRTAAQKANAAAEVQANRDSYDSQAQALARSQGLQYLGPDALKKEIEDSNGTMLNEIREIHNGDLALGGSISMKVIFHGIHYVNTRSERCPGTLGKDALSYTWSRSSAVGDKWGPMSQSTSERTYRYEPRFHPIVDGYIKSGRARDWERLADSSAVVSYIQQLIDLEGCNGPRLRQLAENLARSANNRPSLQAQALQSGAAAPSGR
jgi:hypothetical protein